MSIIEEILMESENLGIRKEVLELVPFIERKYDILFLRKNEIYEKALIMAKEKILDHRTWKSALIKSTEYNSKTEDLIVEFNNGTKYLYQEFPKFLYEEFLAAESKGQFFVSKIRKEYLNNEKTKRL